MNTLNTRVKSLRRAAGFSQRELGQRVGLTQQAIAAIENGKTTRISIAVWEKMATELGVSPSTLVFGDDERLAA